MRSISFFVITQTKSEYPKVVEESFKKGMIYPSPHVYIFKMDEKEEDYSYVRMRPLSERCGTVKDSRLNNNGIGIVLYNPSGSPVNEKAKKLIAVIIKNFIDDFGIIQYQIVTDEMSDESFIDTLDFPALIDVTPSTFNKRI